MINADKLFDKHKILSLYVKMQLLNVKKVGIKCESDTESFVF